MSRIDEIKERLAHSRLGESKIQFDNNFLRFVEIDIEYLLSEIEKRDKRVEMLESLLARNKAIDPLAEVPPFDWGPMGEPKGDMIK